MPPPKGPTKMTIWHWLVLVVIGPVSVWLLFTNPPTQWALGGFVVLLLVGTFFGHRHFKRMSEERKEESICSFARALPARHHDTWVVRAVYEELSRVVQVPVRPSDDLEKDLGLHPDDRDEIAFQIAYRAGRSMSDTPKNPLFDRVKTVADMVTFFEHQKREANQLITDNSGASPLRV
jgi:hypothetical protein